MAQFEPALQRTLKHEAGYANDPADRGGETYRGVARNIHRQWSGWKIVDSHKGKPNFPATLDRDTGLQSLVAEFYRTEFWNKIKGDSISNQTIANELFDSAVNFGVGPAVTLLQKALNFLGTSKRVDTDGGMGTGTMKALDTALSTPTQTKALLGALVSLRGQRYMNIMCDDPTQRVFAVGWFSRLTVG